MNRRILIISVVTLIVLFGFFIGIQTKKSLKTARKERVVAVGLKPSQQEYFSKQLSSFSRELDQIHFGDALVKQGKLDEAIRYFNNLVNDQNFGDKYAARSHLIDAYEKKRDYTMAYQTLYKQQRNPKFVLPVTDPVRVPAEERIKYLKYASQGEYSLALEHAEAAYEASKKEKILKTIPKGYQQRLNDLIASKDYILSLKDKEQ